MVGATEYGFPVWSDFKTLEDFLGPVEITALWSERNSKWPPSMLRDGKGANMTLGSFFKRKLTSPFNSFWDYTYN